MQLRYSLWSAALVLALAASAHADSITTSATGTVLGTTLSDNDTSPPGSAVIVSQVLFPPNFFGVPSARGAAGLFGSGGLSAASVGGTFAQANLSNTLSATSRFDLTPTNTSGGPLAYTFGFTIAPITLSLIDFANTGAANPLAMRASFAVDILLDGASIFSAGATYVGGTASRVLSTTGTDLGGVQSSTGGFSRFDYITPTFSDSLALGTFADGAGFTLTYAVRVDIFAPGFETGAFASFGDPTDLAAAGSGGTLFSSGGTIPPGGGGGGGPVPEPSSLTLCAVVAGAYLWRRRRPRA